MSQPTGGNSPTANGIRTHYVRVKTRRGERLRLGRSKPSPKGRVARWTRRAKNEARLSRRDLR